MEVRTSQHQAFFIGKDVKTKGGREFWVFFDVKATGLGSVALAREL